MAEMVANCPRCSAKSITFDVRTTLRINQMYKWQTWFETFCICRNCHRPTNFVIAQKDIKFRDSPYWEAPEGMAISLNNHFRIERFISLIEVAKIRAPEHTPKEITKIFEEAASCIAVQCWNATGAMHRLCIDLATKRLLPNGDVAGLNSHARKTLAPRLKWLLDNKVLPDELRELSDCIREDGNDAAHDGSLKREDAEDLFDFALALFERIYTEPERLRLAKLRREERRAPKTE